MRGTISDRLWAKVTKTETCWLWTGGKNESGYGILGVGARGSGFQKAHRAAWESVNGPIPDGLCVLHKCDIPACVNPDHLFLGTLKDNYADMRQKGRNVNPPSQPGQSNVNAKLTDEIVREIRILHSHGMMQKDIAASLSMNARSISMAIRGITWKHVT